MAGPTLHRAPTETSTDTTAVKLIESPEQVLLRLSRASDPERHVPAAWVKAVQACVETALKGISDPAMACIEATRALGTQEPRYIPTAHTQPHIRTLNDARAMLTHCVRKPGGLLDAVTAEAHALLFRRLDRDDDLGSDESSPEARDIDGGFSTEAATQPEAYAGDDICEPLEVSPGIQSGDCSKGGDFRKPLFSSPDLARRIAERIIAPIQIHEMDRVGLAAHSPSSAKTPN